jgi:hypothetical protein
MIRCTERELELRKHVYPRRVEAKKMTQEEADRELAYMRAVRQTLLRIGKLYEGIDTEEKR